MRRSQQLRKVRRTSRRQARRQTRRKTRRRVSTKRRNVQRSPRRVITKRRNIRRRRMRGGRKTVLTRLKDDWDSWLLKHSHTASPKHKRFFDILDSKIQEKAQLTVSYNNTVSKLATEVVINLHPNDHTITRIHGDTVDEDRVNFNIQIGFDKQDLSPHHQKENRHKNYLNVDYLSEVGPETHKKEAEMKLKFATTHPDITKDEKGSFHVVYDPRIITIKDREEILWPLAEEEEEEDPLQQLPVRAVEPPPRTIEALYPKGDLRAWGNSSSKELRKANASIDGLIDLVTQSGINFAPGTGAGAGTRAGTGTPTNPANETSGPPLWTRTTMEESWGK